MDKVIFIGGIAHGMKFGGELTKNKFLCEELKKHFNKVYSIDISQAKRNPYKIIKLFFYIFLYPTVPIIYSTSYRNIKWVDSLLCYLMPNRIKILWAIGGNLHQRIENKVYNIKYFKKFHKILVEGNIIKIELSKMGLNNVEVCPNFKTISYIPDITRKTVESEFRFLFFSRITPEKGVDDIFRAVEMLNMKGFTSLYSIDFYGPIDSNYKNDFLLKLDKYGSNVKYKGILNFNESKTYDIISQYHLALFPTFWHGEGFPGVIVDSFIAGLPVLASSWGLNAEIIQNGVNGFIVEPKNSEQISAVLENIINKTIDIEPMFRLSQDTCYKYNTSNVVTGNYLQTLFS